MQNAMQQTPEWFEARLGKLTASRYSDAVAKTRSGWGVSRERYLAELVTERLTGLPYPSFQSSDMKWGNEMQPRAAAEYSFLRDVDITEVGFVPHPTIEMSGASPDGLIGDDGLIEIKCPATHTMIGYLRGAATPIEYILQIQWQLICTGRQWCDLVVYDPRLPVRLQMLIRRIRRLEDPVIATMEENARDFLDEVALAHEELEIMRQQKEAA
jgi:putative phage-type endonuclease